MIHMTLQKRLIKKTEEVVEKDVIIQEKEKLYVELKNILARQPGPEVAEQLNLYQANLAEKTKQLKAMVFLQELAEETLGVANEGVVQLPEELHS